MVFPSVYDMTNESMTTVRKQHFWDYFSGTGISFTTQSAYNYTGGSENSANIHSGSMYGQKLDSGHSGIGKVIVKVDTPVKKYGSPTGTATIRVYAGNGTTILAESSGLDVSTLTTSYVNKSFVLSPEATLETNSRVVIYYSGGDSSNYINIGVGDVGGAGINTSSTRWNGSNWASPTTRDTKMTFDSLPSSQVIPSNRWTYHNLSGTNTPRMSDGNTTNGGGYEIASAGGNGNQACIDFNDKRHYSPRGAVCIGVARSPDLTTGTDGVSYNVGFIENQGHSFDVGAALNFAMSFSYGGFTKFSLHSGNPTEHGSYLDSTTAIDNDWHVHKVETLPSGTRLTIDGVMGAVKTTKLPESTSKLQPRFDMRDNTGGAVHHTAIRYMEAFNT